MLQQMRKLPRWVGFILFLPLVVSFGVWGIGDIFKGSVDTSLATVGGTKIEPEDFQRLFENVRKRAERETGKDLSQAQTVELGKRTLQNMIRDTALDNVAGNLGLMITDDQISATIRGMGFQGPLGSFDEQTFEQAVAKMNFTPATFVAEVRRELTRGTLTQAATAGLVLPPDYVRAIFVYLNERRAAQYIVLPPDAAGAIPPPPDSVLTAYVNAHAAAFSTPEYREVTYATIAPDDLAGQIQVTDQQLHQTYDLRKDKYVIPEKRDIQRINFPDEASAKAARARIGAGTKFDDIAKQRGVSDSDLNLGTLTEADLTDLGPTQGHVTFSLSLDGVSQPLKSTFGWSLLRVTKITPGSTQTFDDVKATLKDELTKELEGSKIEDVLNAFDDARNAGDDLTEAARKVGMRVVRVGAMDAQGMAPNGTHADVPSSPEFLDQVFKSDIGTEGDPFATPDTHRYVIKIDGVIPTKLKPLDTIRAQAIAAWTAEQRRARLSALAAQLASGVTSSAGLLSIASQYHVSTRSTGALARGYPTPIIDLALSQKIFSSPPGKAVFGTSADGNSDIVAWISGVAHPSVPLTDPEFLRFTQLLNGQSASDLQEAMGQAAREKQGSSINQQVADRTIGGEGS